MAQMLSTFSKTEQARFEAFQRARVSTPAVRDWVAACLADRWNLSETRALPDLVAVGQAPDICVVVATLAKIYAQRVVQTAVQLRNDAATAVSSQGNGSTSSNNNDPQQPLTVDWLRQAWEERVQTGLDPGFFLQTSDDRPDTHSSGLLSRHKNQIYHRQRQAALQVQDKYDTWVAAERAKRQGQEEDNVNTDDRGNTAAGGGGDEKDSSAADMMQVDSPEK